MASGKETESSETAGEPKNASSSGDPPATAAESPTTTQLVPTAQSPTFKESEAAVHIVLTNASKAASMGAGDAGKVAPVHATFLGEDKWKEVVNITGICHGYDIDKSSPFRAIEPLFAVAAKEQGRPIFVADDKATVAVDATHTRRHRQFVESGFHATDLDIVVPYIGASLNAASEERQVSEQEKKVVFFTVKADFPRARVDVLQSLRSGYLEISKGFKDHLKLVWRQVTEGLHGLTTDATSAFMMPTNEESAQDTKELFDERCGKATTLAELAAVATAVEPARVAFKRFGAVWVEQVTLGGQIFNTSKEELQWDSDIVEKKETLKAHVSGRANGLAAGIGATMQGLAQLDTSSARGSVNLSQQTVGGDGLVYDAQNASKWLDSVKPPENWRIIGQRRIRQLHELPGLDKDGFGEPGPVTLTLASVLRILCKMLETLVKREEELKRSLRKPLGADWSRDMQCVWFGCKTYHEEKGRSPTNLILKLDENPVKDLQKRTTTFAGRLTDADGELVNRPMTLVVTEVMTEGLAAREQAYEFLGHVDVFIKSDGAAQAGGNDRVRSFRGHFDRTGMHGVWYRDDDPARGMGTWTVTPVSKQPGEGDLLLNETEESVAEPRRRWLLPPQVNLGAHSIFRRNSARERPPEPAELLSAERFAGKWAGLVLDLGTAKLPPIVVLKFEVPELVGGSYGARRYRLVGTGYNGLMRLKLKGLVSTQVTSRPGVLAERQTPNTLPNAPASSPANPPQNPLQIANPSPPHNATEIEPHDAIPSDPPSDFPNESQNAPQNAFPNPPQNGPQSGPQNPHQTSLQNALPTPSQNACRLAQQTPPPTAPGTYPILATIEFEVKQRWLHIPLPLRRGWYWRGHLDHLGVHGYFGRERDTCLYARAGTQGTFSMMPLQPDYERKRWEEARRARARAQEKRGAKLGATEKKSWWRCWGAAGVSRESIDADDA